MADPVVTPAAQWRRQQWRPIPTINRPASEVWIHHSGGGAKNFATLLNNEAWHVRHLGWRALGYSFAVNVDEVRHGYGRIYVGRGWGFQGGHTGGRNHISHGILIVGGWGTASDAEVEAAARSIVWLVEDGHRRGMTRRVVSGGHRDAPGSSTSCPGTAGMRVVRRARELLKSPAPPVEEDVMNQEQDARLKRVEQAVVGLGAAVAELSQIAADLSRSVGGRMVGSDLQRLRTSVRAIAADMDLPTEHPPVDGPVQA